MEEFLRKVRKFLKLVGRMIVKFVKFLLAGAKFSFKHKKSLAIIIVTVSFVALGAAGYYLFSHKDIHIDSSRNESDYKYASLRQPPWVYTETAKSDWSEIERKAKDFGISFDEKFYREKMQSYNDESLDYLSQFPLITKTPAVTISPTVVAATPVSNHLHQNNYLGFSFEYEDGYPDFYYLYEENGTILGPSTVVYCLKTQSSSYDDLMCKDGYAGVFTISSYTEDEYSYFTDKSKIELISNNFTAGLGSDTKVYWVLARTDIELIPDDVLLDEGFYRLLKSSFKYSP